MKKELTVYFDYTCPYCYRGLTDLMELLPSYPQISVNWVPCEAHPRPEAAAVHSDLAGQAMLSAIQKGADPGKFHQEIFTAHFTDHRPIDDPSVLADIAAACGAGRDEVLLSLEKKEYEKNILDNNVLVWDTLAFEAVPCYRSGDKLLASRGGTMIAREELRAFLDSAANE